MNTTDHDTQHTTPAGQSVFADLFSPEEAVELEIRADLLTGLTNWLVKSGLTEIAAAQRLGINSTDIANIQQGKINLFSLDALIHIATRAGLHPRIELEAA
ncbi:helix-turn-helix domain-containing protein [Methylomagnum sp.]